MDLEEKAIQIREEVPDAFDVYIPPGQGDDPEFIEVALRVRGEFHVGEAELKGFGDNRGALLKGACLDMVEEMQEGLLNVKQGMSDDVYPDRVEATLEEAFRIIRREAKAVIDGLDRMRMVEDMLDRAQDVIEGS